VKSYKNLFTSTSKFATFAQLGGKESFRVTILLNNDMIENCGKLIIDFLDLNHVNPLPLEYTSRKQKASFRIERITNGFNNYKYFADIFYFL